MNKGGQKRREDSLGSVHKAVMAGDGVAVREAITRGADVGELDREGRTPLFYSIMDGRLDISSHLIDAGANVNAHDRNLETPLHVAAREYQLSAAKLLLEHGAQVDPRDSHGNTALSHAVFGSKGRGEMIALLLGHSADKHLKNKHGISPDDLARSIANYDVCKFMK
jgi:ankyrin repeat protein